MRAREKVTVFWLESWTLKGERRLSSEATNKHFWNQRAKKGRVISSIEGQKVRGCRSISKAWVDMKLSRVNITTNHQKSISSGGNNWKRQDLQQRTAVLSTFWNYACTLCWLFSRSHGWLCLTVTSLLSSVPSFIGLIQRQQSKDTLFIWLFLMVCFIKTKKSEPVCDFPADVKCGDRR